MIPTDTTIVHGVRFTQSQYYLRLGVCVCGGMHFVCGSLRREDNVCACACCHGLTRHRLVVHPVCCTWSMGVLPQQTAVRSLHSSGEAWLHITVCDVRPIATDQHWCESLLAVRSDSAASVCARLNM